MEGEWSFNADTLNFFRNLCESANYELIEPETQILPLRGRMTNKREVRFEQSMKTVLTIAGFDPSSGAGITADLFVFAAHGLFGTSAITSLTVQSTTGVRGSHAVEPAVLADTLACLQDDLPAAGIKIGMLATKQTVETVCIFLEELRRGGSEIPVVVDPVLRASSGSSLLQPGATHLLRTRLLPLADWVTPNADELGWMMGKLVKSRHDMEVESEALRQEVAALGTRPLNVLTKGGHLDPPDDLLLLANGEKTWLRGTRVDTKATHGTGCALSSALLCRLVLGDPALEAARRAKEYVAEAMRLATPTGHGHGPMNHLWPLRGSGEAV